jgi:DNA-binding CsgD family transcriptional regulator
MIPAGIQQGETEFFVIGKELKAMHNGEQLSVESLPSHIHHIIDRSINGKAHLALDRMGLEDVMARRVQFLKCNCGRFDFTPDLQHGADQLQLEFVACEFRGHCAFEGMLCQPVTINGIKVTMAELRIISFIRKGYYDKEICAQLTIAPDTLRSHKKSIQRKLGADRKTEIATQSIKYGLA